MTTRFLESEFLPAEPGQARWYVIPVPLERSVSYGGGTVDGPSAILEASQQLEGYFEGFGYPGERGICTLAVVDTSGSPAEFLARVRRTLASVLCRGGIPVILGGEHTITYGAIEGFAQDGQSIGVVQFDAHADLRSVYRGDRWSHACVARRIVQDIGVPVFQIGVRSQCREELEARSRFGVGHLDASEIGVGLPGELVLPDSFPERIYVTFDVDAFDASLMPATGTPEPGGLDWWTTVGLLESVCRGRTLVGFDVVELAPDPALRHCSYTAAKLTYLMMGLSQ